MPLKYIIVGTGAAGLGAAESIREADPDGSISIFGDDPNGFYSRPGVAYYLTGEVSQRQLSLRQGVDFHPLKSTVSSIHPQSRLIKTSDNREYGYDRMLLATGSVSKKLTIEGADLKGVVKLDNIEDANEIIRLASKSHKAVVVGGGMIALEMVEGLLAHRVETHFMLRSERYWSNVLDEVESAIVEKRLKTLGVHMHYQSRPTRINAKNDKIFSVDTDRGEQIECQLVAVGIGVQPRMELAQAAGMRTDRGILTNEYLQTSAEDVYAAGDVAQVVDVSSGEASLDALWGIAVAEGRAAGKNMTGSHSAYNKSVAFNVARLAGLTTTIIGAVGQEKKDADLLTISRGDSESWRQIPHVMAVQRDFEFNRTRIMVGTNTLRGAVLMGDQTLSRPLQELISSQVDISAIKSRLQTPQVPLVDTLIDFWWAWRRSCESRKG